EMTSPLAGWQERATVPPAPVVPPAPEPPAPVVPPVPEPEPPAPVVPPVPVAPPVPVPPHWACVGAQVPLAQVTWPLGQVHVPAVQTLPAAHGRLQPPQLSESVWTLVQAVPH